MMKIEFIPANMMKWIIAYQMETSTDVSTDKLYLFGNIENRVAYQLVLYPNNTAVLFRTTHSKLMLRRFGEGKNPVLSNDFEKFYDFCNKINFALPEGCE